MNLIPRKWLGCGPATLMTRGQRAAALCALLFVVLAWSAGIARCGEIHDAAWAGNLEAVKTLLKENPKLADSSDVSGRTPLHRAAAAAHKEIVALLLANHAEVDAKDKHGWTPLHFAAQKGSTDVAELLLASGADVNMRTDVGQTALRVALNLGNFDLARTLLLHGAELDGRTYWVPKEHMSDGLVRELRARGATVSPTVVKQPRLLKMVNPVYPASAKQACVQGRVRFSATISKDGTLKNIIVVSGPPQLIEAATKAVDQWRYKPALLNGEPVEIITVLDVDFTLGPKPGCALRSGPDR
ncbi:MAG: TonB family protein [Bryobacteraceae bacterium]